MDQEHRRLRSRPPGLGRGGDPPLLHEERLRRFPHHQHRRRLSGQSSRLRHHDHDGRGPAVSRLVGFGGFQHSEGGRAGAPAIRRSEARRRLRRERRRQVGRGDHPRRRAARLRLLRGAAARRARHRQPHDRAFVLGRQRSEGLHRAHRHRRQHPHPRLRHSPRIRHRRRRPLQPRDDRAGRATPQQPRLLQEGPHLEPAGVRAGPGDRGRRGRGSADRLDQPQRRLFDDPGLPGRTRLYRDELPRPRPVCAPERLRRPVQPGLEGLVHRALLPRPAAGRRLRPLSSGQQQQPIRALRELDDRRHAAARHSDHRRSDVPAELFALRVEDHHPEHLVAALRRLRGTRSDLVSRRDHHPGRPRRRSSTA